MELGKFIPALCMLLGIMKPSIAVDQDCNYLQRVQPGVTYYVYNPGYPQYYEGQHSCFWRAIGDTRLKLSCNIFIVPGSPNCSRDAFSIQVKDDTEYSLCGLNSFVVESISTEMIIRFRSKYNTFGGKFKCELTAIEENCNCGWKNPNRIVGGVETGVNEYPMMAGLVSIPDRLLYCGSTILTEKYVITAAHCVNQYIGNINDLAIVVGEHNVKRGDETNATQIYLAKNIIIHPRYNVEQKINDVAIVESSQKFIFSMRVGPVCLPFYYTQNDFSGDTVTALGWGTLSFGGKKSNTLMKVDLTVISQSTCAEEYDNLTFTNMCTYGERKDACQFDSGGPILWQNPNSNHVILVGVISYGKTCADNSPGVNMRVTSYLDFIQAATGEYNYCKVF